MAGEADNAPGTEEAMKLPLTRGTRRARENIIALVKKVIAARRKATKENTEKKSKLDKNGADL